ncbi:MAG: glycosyltransferase [Chlorobi bacterium]|nr:glycosyltransferase [Chlorobiota bacterium]
MNEVVLILAIVSLGSLTIFLGFLLYGIYSVPSDVAQESLSHEDISVITAVRNDERIYRLNEAMRQNREVQWFEWVVVDDGSEIPVSPTEADVLVRIHYRRSGRRKKQALRSGIRVSGGTVLAFTDADCVPSDGWLSSITIPIIEGKADLVYGHSVMKEDTFSSQVAIFDHWINSMLTFGLAGHNLHYNATGRSMAIRREVFFRTGEYSSHEEIPSGDDDLLLNEAIKMGYIPMAILNRESVVETDAPKGIWNLIKQRTRHVQTSFHYPFKVQFLLSLFWTSYFASLILPLLLLVVNWVWGLILLGIRWLTIAGFMHFSSNKLIYKPTFYIPATDLLLFFVYIMLIFTQAQRRPLNE